MHAGDTPEELEARKGVAQAFAAIFAFVAGGSFVGGLPPAVASVAGGLCLVGLVAAWRFAVEARQARAATVEREHGRAREEFRRRVKIAPVASIDPLSIGVDRAEQALVRGGDVPDYLPRAADRALREAVATALGGGEPWIVVVTGPSKAGKSRSLFEALRASAGPGVDLVVPRAGDAAAVELLLTSGKELATWSPRSVLWLDDVEPFLNDGLTLSSLFHWREGGPGHCVVGTYGGKGLERIAGASVAGLTTITTAVLQHARLVGLEPTTDAELGRFRSTLGPEDFATLERHGLAAYVVAGPALEAKLASAVHPGDDEACPAGVAVVRAAVDWSRCGRTDPMPDETLYRVWRSHLSEGVAATRASFEAGVAWAERPVAGTIALLLRSDGVRPYDYVVRLVEERRPAASPPTEEAWSAATETASDGQAAAVAQRAYLASRVEDMARALERARASSNVELSARAAAALGILMSRRDRPDEAVTLFDEALATFPATDDQQLGDLVAIALAGKGAALATLGRHDEAVIAYQDLLARFDDPPAIEPPPQIAGALVSKGFSMQQLGDHEGAIAVFDDLIARSATTTDIAVLELVAQAMINKGWALTSLERDAEAVAVYDGFVERFEATDAPGLRERVAWALLNKGNALHARGRRDEAIAVFDEIVVRFGDATEPAIRAYVAWALVGKGTALSALERHDEAIAVCDDLLARFDEAADPAARESIARALAVKGHELMLLGRLEESIAVYGSVVARFDGGAEPWLERLVALALGNTAAALRRLGRCEETVAACAVVVDRFADAADPAVRDLVARALVNKGSALGAMGGARDELALYEKAVTLLDGAAAPAARDEIARAMRDKAVALRALGRSDDASDVYDDLVAQLADRTPASGA
jgi:tetratricopeptide (TPR) repeat protein